MISRQVSPNLLENGPDSGRIGSNLPAVGEAFRGAEINLGLRRFHAQQCVSGGMSSTAVRAQTLSMAEAGFLLRKTTNWLGGANAGLSSSRPPQIVTVARSSKGHLDEHNRTGRSKLVAHGRELCDDHVGGLGPKVQAKSGHDPCLGGRLRRTFYHAPYWAHSH
jgi:hypothetical protein